MENQKISLIFDCDSTLSTIEGMDEIAVKKGVSQKVEEITNLGMEGEISFEESFSKRLKIVKPTKSDLIWLGNEYIKNTTQGAKDLITQMQQQGHQVFMVSGGFKLSCDIFGEFLGIPKQNIFAIDLKFDENGDYLDFDKNSPIVDSAGKKEIAKNIKKMYKNHKTVFVGDGSTDLVTQPEVDLFIGFFGIAKRPKIMEKCKIYTESANLLEIVKIIKSSRF